MANNWQAIDLSHFMPPEIPQAVSSLTNVVDTFLGLYKEAIDAAKVYQASLNSGGPDILGTLVQALVDVVQGLLQAGKVHALFVPIPKHFPQAGQNLTVAPTLDDMALELGFDLQQAAITFSSGANTAYTDLIGNRGGNASFFRTVAESLNDVFDLNRPMYFSEGDAVAMTVLLCGAPSFSGLVEVAGAFNRLFRPQANSDLTSRLVPVPQNLRATVVGLPTATRIGVRLQWDAPQTTFDSPYFPNVNMRVTKYAVIRSTDPKIASSPQSVLDFFSTRDLKVGLTSDDKAHVSKVIAIGSGSNSSYVDDDDTLDKDHTYFYCVAWQVAVEENGVTKTLNYDRVSNVVKTRVRAAVPGQATPPDWAAYGSMLDLVPELAVQVNILLEQIKALSDRQTGGASGSVSTALTLIEKNIDEFMRRLDDLNARVKRFNAIISEPLPALFSTTITGIGGNTFLLGELAARLADTSDPNRPPYDDNEYVLGVCLVAGGPRMPDIQPVVDFLQSLFQPPDPKSPIYIAINAVGDVVSSQEQYVFGPNLQAYPTNADGTVQIPAGTVLPDGTVVPAGGMAVDPATIDSHTGLPQVATNPVIADDGTPIAATDSRSPYTGDP